MSSLITRRTFVAGTGWLCGCAALTPRLGRTAMAGQSQESWPAACVDRILKHLGHQDCWTALQTVGADGVEVEVAADLSLPSLFHPTVKYSLATPADVERFADDAKTAGQQITAFCVHNRFAEQPEVEIKLCGELARAAQTLKVPVIRIDLLQGKLERPDFFKLCVQSLEKILAATEQTGVKFGIENHYTTTNDPAFLDALFDAVESKRLGLTLDFGNFYWFGHPLSKVYELCEAYAPRVFHTHCKNIRYPAEQREKQRPMGWEYKQYARPIDQGDLDYSRIAAILRKAGYDHDLCIENEFLGSAAPAKAADTLTREIQFLKRIRESRP